MGQFQEWRQHLDNVGGKSSFHIPDIINSRLLKSKLIYNKWENEKFDAPKDLIHYWGINDEDKITLNPFILIKNFLNEDKKMGIRISCY